MPPLHAVTDDEVLAGLDFLRHACSVLRAGGSSVALHLRGPRTHGRRLYELAAELVPVARSVGAVVLVNDRVDVALATGAHGVQLGRRGIAPSDARRLVGPARLLGCSVSTPAEGRAAVSGGADFLLVGNLYSTDSHPGRPGTGPERLGELLELGVPLVGIGGITPERVPEVRRARAQGVACIRAIWGAGDPTGVVVRFLDAWSDSDA
ncbi:MAG: thiamine phosphate synthase [Gemmatimonadetes bacterium]|nr:thiamine phosphate synthase [Gemmatimonadota bacterium]